MKSSVVSIAFANLAMPDWPWLPKSFRTGLSGVSARFDGTSEGKYRAIHRQREERFVRIAAASDLHGTYRDVHFPPADVLVVAGDITRSGALAEVADFGAWLKTQPYAATIVVSGNHDRAMEEHEAETRRLLHPAIYLRDEAYEIMGKRFFGSPWIRNYAGAFNASAESLVEKWSAIPHSTDVLITHMPPHTLRDTGSDGQSHGDRGLLARVGELRLKAHVFGHIHEGHGRVRVGSTIFANVAICDRRARPVRPVTRIEV